MCVAGGRRIPLRCPENRKEVIFELLEVVEHDRDGDFLQSASAVELNILEAVIDLKEEKSQNARDVDFTALIEEEFFELVIRERRIFYINFSNDADADSLLRDRKSVV